jgi:hypothetical protein
MNIFFLGLDASLIVTLGGIQLNLIIATSGICRYIAKVVIMPMTANQIA